MGRHKQAFISGGIALSRPVPNKPGERAVIPRFRQSEASKLRPKLWRWQKFVLRTDVSQFYSSLYTHSIPWALHTKSYAKANINKTPGDRIDEALRHMSNGQTIGIPIGPDTSLVAAETVPTAVDRTLADQVGPVRGYRHADDYEAAFRSRAQAEDALVRLEGILGDFELTLNPFKTKILELPQPFHRLGLATS
jgi:hypothetical protein